MYFLLTDHCYMVVDATYSESGKLVLYDLSKSQWSSLADFEEVSFLGHVQLPEESKHYY